MKQQVTSSIALLSLLTLMGCGSSDPVQRETIPDDTFVSETLEFQGLEYKTVQSDLTKQIWLDRNIGAVQVCESPTDMACYGDYFQWGRYMDGHQSSMSSISTKQIVDIDNQMNQEFIIEHSDWTIADANTAQRAAKWSTLDGTSVCPVGFRVPTESEIKAETSMQFLELPLTGMRNNQNGDVVLQDQSGFLWTTSTYKSDTEGDYSIYYHHYTRQDIPIIAESGTTPAIGMPVRCIKAQ